MTLYYCGNKMKLQKDFSRNIYETLLILEQNNTNKYQSIITLINEIKNMPEDVMEKGNEEIYCLLYTSPSPRDGLLSRMPSSA